MSLIDSIQLDSDLDKFDLPKHSFNKIINIFNQTYKNENNHHSLKNIKVYWLITLFFDFYKVILLF